MAACAVEDHPIAGPVVDPFTMRSSKPIPLLAEVTLAAELVAVIKVDLAAFFIFEIIPLLRMVAVDTGKGLTVNAMIQLDIAVGQFQAEVDGNRFFSVAAAALVTVDELFPGQYPE